MTTHLINEATRQARHGKKRGIPSGRSLISRLVASAMSHLARPATRSKPLVFESFEPRILLSAETVVPRIDGTLDVPGETDRYSFTVNDSVRIVFDSLTNNSNMRWSLDGPRGSVVSNRSFTGSDSYELSGNVAFDLAPGEYTLSVDGVADTTGAYSFRLLDIAQSTELTPGTRVDGTLDPANETDAYKFSVVAGQRFFIDRFSNSGDIYWRLLDPYGRTVVDRTHMNNDLGELALGIDGSYTLLIEGRAYTSGTASYSFNVALIDDTITQDMQLGALVTGRIAQAGLRDNYTFTLDEDRRVLFDSLTYDYYLMWSLTGPGGTVISNRRFEYSDSHEVGGNSSIYLRAGTYTLTVDGEGDRINDYAFRLLDMGGATEIQPGDVVNGTLTDGGIGLLRRHETSDAPITYPVGENNGALNLDTADPYFLVADSASLQADGLLTVEAWIRPTGAGSDGTYGGIIVNKEGEYEIARFADGTIGWAFANASPGWTWINTGYVAPLNEWTHIAVVYDNGDVTTYANGVQVHFYDGSGLIGDVDGRNTFQVGSREGGGQRFQGRIDEVRVWTVARTGQEIADNFQSLLAGSEAGLAGYWRMDEATGDRFADLTANANDGLLTNPPGRETHLYKFFATAGERYSVDVQGLSGDNFSLRIFDPNGNLIYGPQWFWNNDVDLFTAAAAGDYVLALEGRIYNGNSSAYQFKVERVEDQTQAMGLNTQINGSIDQVGQRQNFTFTLDADSLLYFDSLTASNSFTWTLAGPRGAEVSSRGMYSSDSGELGGNLVMSLVAGDYTLTIDGSGGTTGAFAFRVLELAAGQAIDYDTTVNASLTPGNVTNIYTFEASAGDRVVYDYLTSSGGDLYWRLVDPSGLLINGPEYMSTDRGPFALYQTGTYYLLMEGRVWQGNPVNVQFQVKLQENLPIPALTGEAMSLGATVNGTLSAAGEVDTFVFDLAGPTRLYFDSLAPNNNGNFRWALVGPRGTEVGDRSMYYSESYEGRDSGVYPVVDLPLAGTYQVRIWANSNNTGAYSFRVLDLADGTVVTPGTPVTGQSLNPSNETDIYRFEGTAGDRLFFDVQSFSPANSDWVTWRLIDPHGRPVWGPANFYYDAGITTLAYTGTYTLLIEGRIWNTQSQASFSYGFNLQPVIDTAPEALTLGSQVDGSLDTAGQTDTYTFSLDQQTLAYFDSLTNANIAWTLRGANGYVVSRNLQSSDSYELGSTNPLLTLAAGDYVLTVGTTTDAVGAYSFRLVDVLAEASEFIPGTVVSDSIDPARTTDFYKFEANAGDRLFFDRLNYSDYYSTVYRLIDPLGNQVWNGYIWPDDQEMGALSLGGTYLLLVEGRIGYGGTYPYSFNMQVVQDLVGNLAVGDTVTDAFTQPGQRAIYSFSLTEDAQLLFDGLTPNNASPDIYWTLTGPRGTEVSSRRFYSSESHELGGTSPLLNLIAGDYTLTLDPQSEQTGAFSFRLLDVATATAIDTNTVVAGQLNPANGTEIYTFNATVGTRYYIDRQALSASSNHLTWRLFDQYGRQLFGPYDLNDVDIFTLPEAGPYTLIVEGRTWNTQYESLINYSFKLLEISDDFADITPGETYGVDPNYTDGPLQGAVQFNSLSYAEVANSDDINLTGSLTLETWFRVDGYASTWQALFYKGNGNSSQRTYTLWLNNAGYLTLTTSNNNNQSVSTASGSVVTGQWHHVAGVIDRGTGKMRIYLDGVLATSDVSISTAAANSSANPLYIGANMEGYPQFQGSIDDVRIWNRALTGEEIAAHKDAPLDGDEAGLVMYLKADLDSYTTLVDATGRGNDGQIMHQWADTPGVVAGTISFGQSDYYRFTLAEDTLMYFDSLTDNYYLRWYLSGPRGTLVSDRPFQQSDASDGTSILNLAAGEYTLRVDGSGDTTGDYGFRLIDLSQAQALELNSVVNGQHTPASSTTAYQFEGVAGDRLYFDYITHSGGTPYWRLLDPWGRTIWGPTYMGYDNIQLQTLPYTGVYTLLIEGRRDSGNGAGSYSFQVSQVSDQDHDITLDGAYGMGAPWTLGQFGSALDFNGLQSAWMENDPALDLNQIVTLETWVKVDRYDNTWTPLFYKGDPNDANQRTYSVWLNSNGSVLLSTGDGGAQSTQTASGLITVGEWHHVAAVMDRVAGTLRVLVDGVQQASITNLRKNPASSNANPLYLGTSVEASSNHASLVGSMDEIRVWNVARGNEDIVATMNAQLVGNEVGLVAYIKADEDGGDVAADGTGNGHDAHLANSTEPLVMGNIEHVGQVANYHFTLSEPSTRVYFDAMTNNSNVRWTLTGPRGTLVSGRHFQQTDSVDGLSLFDLVAGDYTLTIDGYQDFTGEYRFRLLDLSQAVDITLGTPVQGWLNPANETDVYRFDASAGERFYFDTLGASGGNTYWRLLDPWGRAVWGSTGINSEPGLYTLAFDGTYTLLIEGRRDTGAAAASYRFNVQPVADVEIGMAVGDTVSDSIEHAGQRKLYNFDLAADAALYFDSFTNSTSFKWSLVGATGTLVSARNFSGSDSNDYSANPVLKLGAGAYTLIVDADNDVTGNFSFRLADLAEATAINIGDTVSDTLSPGNETHLFRFDASAQDRLRLDLLSESRNTAYWRLFDPFHNVVFGPSATDDVVATMPFDGTYYLVLEGRISEGNTVDYSFKLEDTAVANPDGHTSQDFDSPGLPYVLTNYAGPAAQVMANGYFPATLSANTTGGADSIFLGAPDDSYLGLGNGTITYDLGDYRVINGAGGDFNVYELDNSAVEFNLLRVEVSLDGVNFANITASAAAKVALAGDEAHGNASFAQSYNLEGSGLTEARYIRLTGISSSAPGGSNGFDLDAVGLANYRTPEGDADPDSFLRLTYGSNSSTTNVVGFNSTAAGYYDAVEVDFQFRIKPVSGRADGFGMALLDAATWGSSGVAPSFSVEPNLANSLGLGFDIYSNSEISNNHLSVHFNGTKLADFNISTASLDLGNGLFNGAKVTLTRAAGGALLTVELTPNGGAAFTAIDNYFISGLDLKESRVAFGAATASQTASQDIDNVSVQVTPGVPEVLPALNLGDTISGTLGSATELDRYAFSLNQATRIYFDALTNNSSLRWTLTGPHGTVVAGRQFTSSDSVDNLSVYDLVEGDYVLNVYGTAASYQFRMLDLATASDLAIGDTVSGQLSPANETDLYSFHVNAGEKFYFDRISESGGNTYWRLLDPYGRTVWGSNDFNVDAGLYTLAYTGTYTLMMEGRYNATGTGSYSFQVQNVVDGARAIDLGESVASSLAVKGQSQVFSFTLDHDAQVYFDNLTTNSQFETYYLRWYLSGPQGTLVSDKPFRDSDSYDGTSIYDLIAGDYTLTVTSTNEITGNFGFRVLDLSEGTGITPGDVVESSLDPANQTDVYKFDASAGERFWFDYLSRSGGDIYWRLLDPYGRTVWGPTYLDSDSQIGVRTLDVSGTYTLLVEGRYYTSGSVNYSFKVQPVVNDQSDLTLNAVQTGSIAYPGQQDLFTFTLTEAKRVYFDSQNANYYLRWYLSGPQGTLVSNQPLRDSDSANGTFILDLIPGTYTLLMAGDGGNAGDYAFRLLDLGTAQTISTGAPISGTLNPAVETDAYQFTAQAGDRFFFDRTSVDNYYTYWRLLDPWGRTVWGPTHMYYNDSGDVDVTTLAFDGVYTLLIEGQYPAGTGQNAYSFNVSPSPLSEKIVISGLGGEPGPDLIVEGLTVTPVGATLAAGGQVELTWQVTNNGTEPANAPWLDRILVRNLDRSNELIVNVLVNYDDLGDGADDPLLPGESRTRHATVVLPAGNRGAGNLRFEVTTDVTNAVAEPGVAELNNSSFLNQVAELTPYPDLQVDSLTVTPGNGWAAGQTVTLNWRVNNTGNAPVDGAWTDSILVRNLSTGATLLNATLHYDPAVDGNVGAGESRLRAFNFTWPAGVLGSGQFEFIVTTDSASEVFENNPADTGESNNSARITATSAPDLVVQNLHVAPAGGGAQAQAGDSVTVTWDDLNLGLTATPASWNDRIIVTNLDTGETLLNIALPYNIALVGNAALAPNASLSRSHTFQLPEGVRGTGQIQVQVITDQNASGQGALVEYTAAGASGENNNSASVSFSAAAKLYADLVVSQFSAPLTGRGGEQITVDWTVLNQGGVPTSANWIDRIILSDDAIIGDADDVVLANVAHAGALGVGASYAASQSVSLPLYLNGGFYLAVVSDAQGQVLEPDTRADNTSAPRAITLAAPHADLQVEVVDAPATAHGGEVITLAWRVRNAGDASTDVSQWKDYVYLSSDTVLDAGDIKLAEATRSGVVAKDGSYTLSANIFAPNNVTGNYYFLIKADAENLVYEAGLDDNNTGASLAPTAVSPAPVADLQVTAVGAIADGVPGEKRAVSWTVTNGGDAAAAGTWSDRIYLTKTGTLNGAIHVGTLTAGRNLAAGASYSEAVEITLPSVADDVYQILIVTDYDNQIYEVPNENNNQTLSSASFAIIHPDLRADAVRVPATAQSGAEVVVEWDVSNAGSSPLTGIWTDKVYLSRDGVVGSGDILLLSRVVNRSLAVGEGYTETGSFILPIEATGDYQIIVVTDAASEITELNAEGNNKAAASLSVDLAPYADLVTSAVVAPQLTIDDPARITVSWTVSNEGNGIGITHAWTDAIVASRDGIAGNGDDIVLARYAHAGALGVGESYTREETFYLPPAFEGRYNLFVRADADGQVFENDLEANNAAAPAHVFDVMKIPYSDLVIDSVAVADGAMSGRALDLTWVVRNQGIGLTNSDSWNDRVYLSPNADGSNRTYLGAFNHIGFLAPDGSYTRTGTVALPNGISGTFYLIVETSGPFEFVYTGNNSIRSDAFQVELSPAPDLVVTQIVTPAAAPEGSAVDISWTVLNQGQGDAEGTWTDTLYLRKAGETGAGTAIGSFTYQGPLQAGMSYSRREQVVLPIHTSDHYEILVVTDSGNKVYEHGQENNNQSLSDTQISVSVLPRPDLQVVQITGPAVVDAGGTASVEFTIINQGTVATNVPNWTDRVYLSLDDKISNDDILVSSLANGAALAPGEQYLSLSSTFKVPERFRGTVYAIVVTDAGGAVDEWPNDTNNIKLLPIYVNPWPFADLVVHDVKSPAQAFEGNQVEVRYTVTNRGSGPTNIGSWTEQVWLTKDKNRPHPGQGDILLTSFVYNGGALAVGEGYDRILTVSLPDTLVSGEYYITPWVDPYAQVLEDTLAINVNPDDPNEINNNNYKAGGGDLVGTPEAHIKLIGTPPAVAPLSDVYVHSVAADSFEWAGEEFSFSWTVTNQGPGTTNSGWTDNVYLSDNAVYGAAGAHQFSLGGYANLKSLATGESYTNTRTVTLEPSAKGMYLHVVTQGPSNDSNNTNHRAKTVTEVLDRIPDLKITAVVPEASAFSGEKTKIVYTVLNDSDQPIWDETAYWTDKIYLSKDPNWIPDRSRVTLLSVVQQSNAQPLGAHQSYTREVEVTLPPGIEGDYFLYVFTNVHPDGLPGTQQWPVDQGDGVFEKGNGYENFYKNAYEYALNNMFQASLPVIYREPDLRVTDLVVPDTVAAGSVVDVTFTVTNVGTRETREASWTDRIYLSLDASLDNYDLEVASQSAFDAIRAKYGRIDGKLKPGESYTATVHVTIPYDVKGDIHLLAYADSGITSGWNSPISSISPRLKGLDPGGDADGTVREFQDEGNNITVAPITVVPYTPPDLQVISLSASERATRGQNFEVSYTVVNLGGDTPIQEAKWDDLVYLSRDAFLDTRADRFIGTISHEGGLAAGGAYSVSKTYTVPTDLPTEAYYVFVVTDPARYSISGAVYEANERNNDKASDVPMVIELPPPTPSACPGRWRT